MIWVIFLQGILILALLVAVIRFYQGFRFYQFHKNLSPDLTYRLQITPTVKFKYISKASHYITGSTVKENKENPFLPLNTVSDRHRKKIQDLYEGRIGGATTMEVSFKKSNGDAIYWLEQHVIPYYDWQGRLKGYNGIARDITEKKALEQQLLWVSRHDQLTGVFNRNYLEETLREPDKLSYPMTVLYCDFDNMKTINDEYGHDQGDYILQTFTQLLKKKLPPSSSIFRYGGDEFVIFIEDAYGSIEINHLMNEIRQPISSIKVKRHSLTVSIGYSTITDASELSAAIKQADEAMYRDKRKRQLYGDLLPT
ncbi:sensor domain-containing diguanylate cyclase [Thalassobacillus hwangdonensis]|uniref:Diguanylate cyclase n=1 Tax=Thalassobacillus hwangdonensis TaxID=546108 RepID=A0ABW3L452_9BACI